MGNARGIMLSYEFQLYWATAAKHPCALAEAISAQNIPFPPGGEPPAERVANNLKSLLTYLSSYASETNRPASEHDLIRDAVLMAQTDFARLDCRAPRSEDSLTGSLLSRLSSAVIAINRDVSSGSDGARPPIGLWSIELIRQGREQRLGGDLALVMERDRQLFATCLQAKRADPKSSPDARATANISQPKSEFDRATKTTLLSDHLWQLDKLRNVAVGLGNRVSAAYIFYNNGERGTAEPIFPLVKDINRLESNIDAVRRTDLNSGTVDFASYVTRIIGNTNLAISPDPVSLYGLARLLSDSHFTHIVYVGSSVDFVLRLRKSFDDLNPDSAVMSDMLPTEQRALMRFVPQWPDNLPEPNAMGMTRVHR
jgi:hypothetical protein